MHHIPGRQSAAPEIRPIIAEILRTCIYPTPLNLRVEHVTHKPLDDSSDSESGTRSGHITKLFLTDGRLLIQALLHRRLSTLPEVEQLKVGDVVEIHKYNVKKAQRKNRKGHVVFMGIENCYVIKAEVPDGSSLINNNTVLQSTSTKRRMSMVDDDPDHDDMAGGFCREVSDKDLQETYRDSEIHRDEPLEVKRPRFSRSRLDCHDEVIVGTVESPQKQVLVEFATPRQRDSIKAKLSPSTHSESEEEGAFETAKVDLNSLKKRRQVLHELSQNVVSSPSRPPTRESMSSLPEKITSKAGDSTKQKLVTFGPTEDLKVQVSPDQSAKLPPPPGTHRFIPDKSMPRHDDCKPTPIQQYPAKLQSAHTQSTRSTPSTPDNFEVNPHWGPLHVLSSLYSPSLPSKSYTFTALVIPTHVASHLISRPNSAFPPKRHIKVVDPSLVGKLNLERTNILGKGITVSVYRDAVNFKPTVGTVALMRGVVMQRLNSAMKNSSGTRVSEVILNVYPEKSRIQRQSQNNSHGDNLVRINHPEKGQEPAERAGMNHDQSTARGQTNFDFVKQGETHLKSIQFDMKESSPYPEVAETYGAQWFIDDRVYLCRLGYDVDAMQHWWDSMMLGR